ncbi:MAG: hypothetical protein M3N23_03135, partial [Pseudomonadota bacterium]|nr:hypothetical protein [Pseudomonadota bacterium]
MMLNSRRVLRLAIVSAIAMPWIASAQNAAAPGQQRAEVTPETYHDHSPSLRGIMPLPDAYYGGTAHVHDVKRIPNIDSPGFT